MNYFCHQCDEHRAQGQIKENDDGTLRCLACGEDYVEIVDEADPPQEAAPAQPAPPIQQQPQPFANIFGPNAQTRVQNGPFGQTVYYSYNLGGQPNANGQNQQLQNIFQSFGFPAQAAQGQQPQAQPQPFNFFFPFGQQNVPGQNGTDPFGQMFHQLSNLFQMPIGNFQFGGGGRNLNDILHELLMNSGNMGPPPASAELIEQLEEVIVDEHYKETAEAMNCPTHCAICQDEFAVDDRCKIMPCKHTYHHECIERWLSMHNSCPICRLTLTEQQTGEHPEPSQKEDEEMPDTSAPPEI